MYIDAKSQVQKKQNDNLIKEMHSYTINNHSFIIAHPDLVTQMK